MNQKNHFSHDPIWQFVSVIITFVLGLLSLISSIFNLPEPGQRICFAIGIVFISSALILIYIIWVRSKRSLLLKEKVGSGVMATLILGVAFLILEPIIVPSLPYPIVRVTPTSIPTITGSTATPKGTPTLTATTALTPTAIATSPVSLTGKTLFHYTRHKFLVNAIAWSPNGQYIASGGQDNTVQIWQSENGQMLHTLHVSYYPISAIAWSPDSKLIAAATDANATNNTVQIFNAYTGDPTFSYTGQPEGVAAISWSPKGNYIASVSIDSKIHIWNVNTGSDISTFYGDSFAWSPSGDYIAVETLPINGMLSVSSFPSGQNEGYYYLNNGGGGDNGSAGMNIIAWSPDSERIAVFIGKEICDFSGNCDSTTLESTVDVVSRTSGPMPLIFSCQDAQTQTGSAVVSWSPNGNYIAFALGSSSVQVCDATTGYSVLTFHGHTGNVSALTWSPDSRRIASADDTGDVIVWQVWD